MIAEPSAMKSKQSRPNRNPEPLHLTPTQLMHRWRCSRSGVDVIAAHAGLTRRVAGESKRRNSVYYLLMDIIAYEQSCMQRA